MQTKTRSVHQIIEDQARKWQMDRADRTPKEAPGLPVVTISRDPGSGGKIIAAELANALNMDLFHQEVIHEMAKSAKVSTRLLATLDERGLSMLEDWISSLVDSRHLWPDQYLQHLLKVIGTIGKHGAAVLVGRGANFVLPEDKRLRVRVIAPRDIRVKRVAEEFGVAYEEARKRILKTESDRKAFIRKYFHADIEDPQNYDVVLNTGRLSIAEAVKALRALLGR